MSNEDGDELKDDVGAVDKDHDDEDDATSLKQQKQRSKLSLLRCPR